MSVKRLLQALSVFWFIDLFNSDPPKCLVWITIQGTKILGKLFIHKSASQEFGFGERQFAVQWLDRPQPYNLSELPQYIIALLPNASAGCIRIYIYIYPFYLHRFMESRNVSSTDRTLNLLYKVSLSTVLYTFTFCIFILNSLS